MLNGFDNPSGIRAKALKKAKFANQKYRSCFELVCMWVNADFSTFSIGMFFISSTIFYTKRLRYLPQKYLLLHQDYSQCQA